MRSIRFAVLASAAALFAAAFVTPLAVSQAPRGHMSEEEILEMNAGAETEWRLPGGGIDCGSTCPSGLKCCPARSMQ